jgi:queuosine precursor transporter
MLADVSSLRIVTVAGLAVDAGTLVYPFTFTLRDLVHKIAGKEAARILILTAAAINVAMAGLFWLVARLPADAATGPQAEFGQVLSPVWRIVVASILAEVISELADTEVYQRWVRRMGERNQWGRVLVSNGLAIPVDSGIFVVIAFLGVLPGSVVTEIFWANVIAKFVVTIVSIPWIYLVKPAPFTTNSPVDVRAAKDADG